MPRIFISYRRQDSITAAGRIYDTLSRVLGESSVFLDTEDIPPGVEWDTYLNNNINSCDTVLVIMGDKWLDLRDAEGNRRIDDDQDFVRFEVEVALNNPDITVIPILLKDTQMPTADELPASIRDLPRRKQPNLRKVMLKFSQLNIQPFH